MTLNPLRLRLLAQLDTLGTIRAVAVAANISPSSVSQQLAVLEAETKSRLLERTGRRVRLTPTGLILARRAREVLDHLNTVEAELRSLAAEPSGLVRLAAFQSAIHSIAVPAVLSLATSHPQIDVELHELEPHSSMPALRSDQVDVIITTTDFLDQPIRPDVVTIPLSRDHIIVVLPLDHWAARGDTVDIATLADEDWAFDMTDSYGSNLATSLCRQAGFEPKVVCRFNNYMITLGHVEAGLSIALLPSLAIDRRYRVATRPLTTGVNRNIVAAIRNNPTSSGALGAVLDAIRVATGHAADARPT